MFILDMYHTTHFRDTVMTVLPQKSFNSYEQVTTDLLGTPGQWCAAPAAPRLQRRHAAAESYARACDNRSSGDFMAHFAGHPNAQKFALVQKYMTRVLPFEDAANTTNGTAATR